MSKKQPRKKSQATRSVGAGLDSDTQHGAVVPPIYLSSNFSFEAYRRPRKYDYTRSGNPTRDQLAHALADLEGGVGAVVTCTGLAAITLMQSFPLHVVNDNRSRLAFANGQYILIERKAYDAAGGHRAVRERFVEDIGIAEHVKSLGLPIRVALVRGLVLCRM